MGIADWTFDVAWPLKLLAHFVSLSFLSLHTSVLKIPYEGPISSFFAHYFFWSYRGVREAGGASLVG